jgi:hypothetical protein
MALNLVCRNNIDFKYLIMYSFNKITNVDECDALLTWAKKEKSDLTLKKVSVKRLMANYSSTSVIDTYLQGVIAKIGIVEAVIRALPEGPRKESEEKKKLRLEYRKFLLESKKESNDSVALLERELDLERINIEVDEVDLFIAGVTDRKTTLQ